MSETNSASNYNSKFVELYQKKQFNVAEDFIKKAIEIDPSHTDSLYNYATFLQDIRKDYPKAEEFYLKAFSSNPKDVSLLTSIAGFFKKIRLDFTAAEQFYLKAVEADPNNASVLNNYAQFLKTIRKDAVTAEEYFLKAIECNPKHPFALNNYGLFLKEKKDFVLAEHYFRRAVECNTASTDIFFNFALFLHVNKKEHQEAEQFYQRALKSNPKHLLSLFHYGQYLHEVKQDYAGAEEFYREAINLQPEALDILYSYTSLLITLRKNYDEVESLIQKGIKLQNGKKTDRWNSLLEELNRVRSGKTLSPTAKNTSGELVSLSLNPVIKRQASEDKSQFQRKSLQPIVTLHHSSSAEGVSLSTEDVLPTPSSPVPSSKLPKSIKRSGSRALALDPLPKRPDALSVKIDDSIESQLHLKPLPKSPKADETKISDVLADIRFEEDPFASRERSHSVAEIQNRDEIKDANMSHLQEPYLFYIDPVTGKETRFNIVKQTTNIGRKEDNDLVLFSKYVSRYHCRLDVEVVDGQTILVFKDLSSRSKINGEKPVQHRMMKGDVIKVGKTILLYMDKFTNDLCPQAKKEGLGWKQGTGLLKTWQSHYFVLNGPTLLLFKNQKDRQQGQLPAFIIDLEDCNTDNEEENTFMIESNRRNYNLKFTTPGEKEEVMKFQLYLQKKWITTVRQAIHRR